MSGDPKELPEGLEQAFAEARRVEPSAAQLEQLRSTLGPTLDAPMTGPRATKIASAKALGVKLGLGGLLLLLLGVGLRWSTPTARPNARPAPTRTNASAEPGSAGGGETRTPAPTRDVPPATTPSAPEPSRDAAATRPHRPVRPRTPRRSSETELLDRAQAALTATPSQTLRLTRRHARLYPNGALTQEREALAIRALVRTGHVDAAGRRLARFARRWPNSAHLHGLRQLVDERASADTERGSR